MRLIFALALVVLGSTKAAIAQDDIGPSTYLGLRGSLAFEGSIDAKANTAPPVTAKANFKVGGGASVFWGLELPAGFNAELELLYRYMPLDDLNVVGLTGNVGGYGQMFAPMANVYWTIPLDLPVRPYIGGGLGYAWNEVGLKSIGTTSFQTLHDDNWRLAYNAMAGFVVPVSPASRLTVGYRWLHEDIGVNCGSSVTCSGKMNSQSIDVGYAISL
jgi:opacity protein-like surface antigen